MSEYLGTEEVANGVDQITKSNFWKRWDSLLYTASELY